MRNTTKKLLLLVAVVAVMVAALAVSAFAYINWDAETSSFPGGVNSSYADINAPGWMQVAGTGTAFTAEDDGDYDDEGDLPKSNGAYRMYFNESTGTLVIEMKNDWESITGGNNDHTTVSHSSYWLKNNASKITTLELRNVGHLNNLAYVTGKLSSVKTVKITTACNVQNGSKVDTGAFVGLKSMDTLLWGNWDKETGKFTKTLGEEGVVDLGGFQYLDIMSTTYNGTHVAMYAGYIVAETSVTKLILPSAQGLKDPNRVYSVVVVSDGTYVDGNAGTSGNPNSNYGKTIAEGRACTLLRNKETGETGYTVFWALDSASWEAVKVKAAEMEPFYGDYSGIIPFGMAYGAKSLAEVVVPEAVTLRYIEASAFSGCDALKTIDIKGSVASDFSIEAKSAFTGVTDLVIKVYSERNKTYVEKALSNAGVTGVTVTNMNPPEASAKDKAIVADGFSIRQTDTNAKTKGPALRAEFTLVDSVVGNAGAEIDDFGVIVFSANTFVNVYNEDIYAIYDAVIAGTDARIIRKSAKNGPYIAVHDNGDITFAAAITGIPKDNYTSAIYTFAYVAWSDGTYTYVTYTSERTGKTAHSLYDMTIFAFRNGLLNSENTDADKLFPVLEKGALPYAGNINTSAENAYDTNKTSFFSNPLYAYADYAGFYGNSRTLETTSSTNVLWSIFVDGDEYVAVYHKGSGTGEALLPGVAAGYTNSGHPFSSNYKRADAKTPATTGAVYQKIKTLVIDYGIEGTMINGDGALGGMAYITTIVYPNGFDSIAHYRRDWKKVDTDNDGTADTYKIDSDGDGDLYDGDVNVCAVYVFAGDTKLTDVIWANNDGIPHMKDFILEEGDTEMTNLFDLRGIGSWSSNQEIFVDTPLIKNVVFGAASPRPIYKNLFKSITGLERAWFQTTYTAGETYEAPAYKTIDLGIKTGWGSWEGTVCGIRSNGYIVKYYSGNAGNPGYSQGMFFSGDNAATLTVRFMIVDANGNPADPATAIARLAAKITDTTVLNRIYVYQTTGENAGKYVNAAGTVYSE